MGFEQIKNFDKSFFEGRIRKTTCLKERIRLYALSAYASGHSVKEITSILSISESALYGYLRSFDPLQISPPKTRSSKPCKLSKLQEQEFFAYVRDNQSNSIQQLVGYVKNTYDVSYTTSGLRDLLKRNALKKRLQRLTSK